MKTLNKSISSATDKLQPADVSLRTYTGETLTTLGCIDVLVQYESQALILPLIVVKGHGSSLFRRNWLEKIKLNWSSLHTVTMSSALDDLLQQHQNLFHDQLGTLKGFHARLAVDPTAQPCFFKPRPVPYVLTEKVKKELKRLQDLGIIKPVSFSDWAAPIVPVVKSDTNIRICDDYKVIINQASQTVSYPLPRVGDLFAALFGGTIFTKLDLSHAYQQILLDKDSKKFTTINTHKGLFQYQRLPFGISTAPALFQRTMESLLQGLSKVCVYIDDILVAGVDEKDHLHNLGQVLERLESAGLSLKKSKCVFMTTSVEYPGHVIDATGLHLSISGVKAIKEAPQTTNKSFLGLLNYYNKFLPNVSTFLAPLHRLLCKDTKWKWSKAQAEAFKKAKDLLQSFSLLVHFDGAKPLLLSCDAPPYSLGAVLAHKMDDNSEKPIAFISRTLSPAEKNILSWRRRH